MIGMWKLPSETDRVNLLGPNKGTHKPITWLKSGFLPADFMALQMPAHQQNNILQKPKQGDSLSAILKAPEV